MIWMPRYLTQQSWHPWFAWRPVTLEDGRAAWWERIERKIVPQELPPFARGFYRIPPGDLSDEPQPPESER